MENMLLTNVREYYATATELSECLQPPPELDFSNIKSLQGWSRALKYQARTSCITAK